MKVKLISYANKTFFKSQKVLKESALRNGVDDVIMFNNIWLKNQREFYLPHKKILDHPRGAGYWLWKPYIIYKTLQRMDESDILFYMDSGCEIVNHVAPLVKLADEKEIVLFYCNGHKNSTWTKRDCFFYMDCDERKYHYGDQVVATYVVFKKTKGVVNLVLEWLDFAKDERIISDNSNVCGLDNLPDFKDHRHDQSILANLAIKYNRELFRDPSQFGNYLKLPRFRKEKEFKHTDYSHEPLSNSPYETLFNSQGIKYSLNLFDKVEYGLRSIIKINGPKY